MTAYIFDAFSRLLTTPWRHVAGSLLPSAQACHKKMRCSETGTSGQRRSHGNVEQVRFLDSHEGGVRAVFARVQLLHKDKTPHDRLPKIAHR